MSDELLVKLGASRSELTGLLLSEITEFDENGNVTSERKEYSPLLDAHIRKLVSEELRRLLDGAYVRTER